jgi:hypothetical protein
MAGISTLDMTYAEPTTDTRRASFMVSMYEKRDGKEMSRVLTTVRTSAERDHQGGVRSSKKAIDDGKQMSLFGTSPC